jgi:hypothetical protein
MTNYYAASIATLFLFAFSTWATDEQIVKQSESLVFAIPRGSPVKFSESGEYPGQAKFTGSFLLRGTFQYGYLHNEPERDATYGIRELYFYPDTSLSVLLPRWKKRGNVNVMRIKNSDEFVSAVIPGNIIKDIEEKKRFSVNGRAAIWVNKYEVSIECDYPTYTVSFQSMDQITTTLSSRSFIEQHGC